MRDIIPLRELFHELIDCGLLDAFGNTTVECMVFKDNAACLELAIAPKMRLRTKHINIKYHHFRSHMRTEENKDGTIEIKHVGTAEQVADIFTKPLPYQSFSYLQKKLMGWDSKKNSKV